MLYAALATDYDGTIALRERVPDTTVHSLRWLKDRGKTLILVTGRELPELQHLFPELGLFDAVVAENGAVMFLPGEGEVMALAPPPPPELVKLLKMRGVSPLSVGSSIVATWSPHETTVLEAVHELGLEWQITFNKGAVMCLPPGVNKASGLAQALRHLKLSPLNVIAIGDAENDHAFLAACGYSAAVANALDSVKQEVDLVTRADHGDGVSELIDSWMGDQSRFGTRVERHGVALSGIEGGEVHLFPACHKVLIAGGSGGGKSSFAMALMELILETGAQLVAIDPEGDYESVEGPIRLGTASRAPSVQEAGELLDQPDTSLLLGLLAVAMHDRAKFLAALMAPLVETRARFGRPHWLLVDEVHHFLPAETGAPATMLANAGPGSVFITVEPASLAPAILEGINLLIAIGPAAPEIFAKFCVASGREAPDPPSPPGEDEAWLWDLESGVVTRIAVPRSRSEHRRHVRKYAEGNLSEQRSFFFRGPEKKLKLRAHNLRAFLELADGVDAETWLYHLHEGDYSRWLRETLGDDELACEIETIEARAGITASEGRALVRAAVERRYTAPVN